jgi:anti-sigma-K factor RskA
VKQDSHISQEDLALYATQSLSADESAAIRAHLAACALCRSELAEISGDLALLALSVEQQPLPDGARQRFLKRLDAEPAPERLSAQTSERMQKIDFAPPPAGRGFGFWIPWAVATVMTLIAVSLGLQNRSLNDQLQGESSMVTNLAAKASRAQQVLEVLSSPAAQRVVLTQAQTPAEPSGRAAYLADRGGLVFLGSNLKPLPADKAYELWVIPANGKAPLPAGVFRPDAVGFATVVLPPIPSGVAAKAFGITVEKASGSSVPTSPILLSGSVPGA